MCIDEIGYIKTVIHTYTGTIVFVLNSFSF